MAETLDLDRSYYGPWAVIAGGSEASARHSPTN